MKAITFTALGIAVATIGFITPVQAQSTKTPNSEGKTSSVNGNSLIGIDNRTAQDDFSKFFGVTTGNTLSGSATQNNTATPIRFNETLSLPDTLIFLQPGPESMNGNDGAQVQVDLSGIDRPAQK